MTNNSTSEPGITGYLRLPAVIAALAIIALLVTGAIVWPGYDAREAPEEHVGVWVLQNEGGRRYARVNTELGEIDTVRGVENATKVLQSGGSALLLADGNARFAALSEANPPELSGETADLFVASPPQTVDAVANGKHVAFRTDEGKIFVGSLDHPEQLFQIDPYSDVEVEEGEEAPVFPASAIALSDKGTVAALSLSEDKLVVADARTGEVTAESTWDLGDGLELEMAFAGDSLVVFEPATATLWHQGESQGIDTGAEGTAFLQDSGPSPSVLISDSQGLLKVEGTETSRVVDLGETAEPAAPLYFNDVAYAAWLGPNAGVLWADGAGETPLSYGQAELPESFSPRLMSNGSRLVVNDVFSGWVWLAPSGDLVASSQHWDVDEELVTQVDETVTEKVVDPRPPVAEPDSFGVRAGREVLLPVLLNDHDPNQDVLTIVPDSLQGLPEDFGSVAPGADNQHIVVSVAPGATGSETFTYRVTDGTSADGLRSEPATVTLSVVPEETSNAPVWCGTEGCLAPWPTPTVEPGGTVTVQVLPGWVDPEGDPLYLSGVETPDIGAAIVDPGGTVTYQHPDANVTDPVTVALPVTVSDTTGKSSIKTLNIQVTPDPHLDVSPAVATGVTGQAVTVDLRSHISGQRGKARLTAVAPLTTEQVDVTFDEVEQSIALTAQKPGSYPVEVTVSDDIAEVKGIVRVTLTTAEDSRISAVPLTVFIRPLEDTTVDIMPAVTNPQGLVLLVDQLEVTPNEDAELSANVVGQRDLHASGRTLSGKSGTLGYGTYQVSDGSGDPRNTARGQVTFVLLDEATASAPITTDVWVTVPAGTQMDIPVLDTDIAPVGSQLTLDPASIVNEQQAGLAFASRRVLRYLAPQEPGEYSITYAAARLGFPDLTSTARVYISVVAPDAEVVPRPKPLSARVLQGASVRIPFDRFEVSQRGGAVHLSQITKQPTKGSAAISPEGDAIIYTASPGASGQDVFEYEVRDQTGKVGTASVQMGILDAQADPRPITYSDYVQVQQGGDAEALVFPTQTDIDPGGGELFLVDVKPNADPNSQVYTDLESRLRFDAETGEVQIKAGAELGTSSFIYTVRNQFGDTAMGLIIVKVVRGEVPDAPVVQDTILTAETVNSLPQGIDVVSDKVSWNTGETSSLTLSLWEETPGFSVSAWSIAGPVPSEWMIVPFRVEGKDFSGESGSSYGFLRIPGPNDVYLALKAGYTEVTVNEGASVDLDVSQAVAFPSGETLEVDSPQVHASGIRQEAQCSISGMTVTYSAGAGPPWQDTCTIPVKLASQEFYTYLPLAVKIIPKEAQPTLRNASFEVSPGQTAPYDLNQMVVWEGDPLPGNLEFAVQPNGSLFQITSQGGSSISVTGNDDSRQGQIEQVTVSLPSHPDVPAATLALTVGPAPTTLPRGGTVSKECAVNDPGCGAIPVIGAPGEVNPLRTPLELVPGPLNVSGCGAAAQAEGNSVVFRYGTDTPGGTCTANFSVRDAQGREGTGTAILNLRGLPQAPTSVEWLTFSENSVTVRPIAASGADQPITGFAVTGAGSPITCAVDTPCTVSGLTVGEKKNLTVRSVNAVGESLQAASITVWSYAPPRTPSVAWEPVPNGNEGRRAKLLITRTDATTGRLKVNGEDHDLSGEIIVNVPNNEPRDFTVVPVSRFDPPPVAVPPPNTGGDATVTGVHGIGAPSIAIGKSVSGNQLRASVSVTDPNGAQAGETKISIVKGESCTPGSGDSFLETPLRPGETATITACAQNVRNGQTFGDVVTATDSASRDLTPPTDPGRYGIEKTGRTDDNRVYVWDRIRTQWASGNQDGTTVRYGRTLEGAVEENSFDSLLSEFGAPAGISAFACVDFPGTCSSGSLMGIMEGLFPAKVSVSFADVAGEQCPANIMPTIKAVGVSKDQLRIEPGTPGGTTTVTFPWDTSLSWSCSVPPEETPDPPDNPDPGD